MSPKELLQKASAIIWDVGKGKHQLDLMDWADAADALFDLIADYVHLQEEKD